MSTNKSTILRVYSETVYELDNVEKEALKVLLEAVNKYALVTINTKTFREDIVNVVFGDNQTIYTNFMDMLVTNLVINDCDIKEILCKGNDTYILTLKELYDNDMYDPEAKKIIVEEVSLLDYIFIIFKLYNTSLTNILGEAHVR